MIVIQNKADCCGCTACVSVCPAHCIVLSSDAEGFTYPQVDNARCLECGACQNVCPVKAPHPRQSKMDAYVVQDKRRNIRESSSSGGAFTAMAEYVIARQGTVYGAAYDEQHHVRHIGVRLVQQLEKFRGSKYVQSCVEGIFPEIQHKLIEREWVLFSGTPCQVAGLKKYLRNDYPTLLTVDLACHGVPSPKLWALYLAWWRNKENSELESVEFRSKKYGYSGSTMRLIFANGHEYSRERMLQMYKNAMFAGLSMRPSCHNCHFKTQARASDYTIFDCWHVNTFCSDMDDDRGTTALLVQSEKGNTLLPEISAAWVIKPADRQRLIEIDGDMMMKSAPAHALRAQFFQDMESMNLQDLNEKYFPMTLKKRLVLLLKPAFYRLGILNKIKRKLK